MAVQWHCIDRVVHIFSVPKLVWKFDNFILSPLYDLPSYYNVNSHKKITEQPQQKSVSVDLGEMSTSE